MNGASDWSKDYHTFCAIETHWAEYLASICPKMPEHLKTRIEDLIRQVRNAAIENKKWTIQLAEIAYMMIVAVENDKTTQQ
jgi:hypothetical protein